MRREGRQHGMVRTFDILSYPCRNPGRESSHVNVLKSPPTAGLFTKVSTKPTNHSKFTGKCGKPRCTECHMSPSFKSKIKAKGTAKLKSCHMVSSYDLVTWRVVDVNPEYKVTGFSASKVLDHLTCNYVDDDHLEVDYDYDDDNCDIY